jgi:peptidoglycan pentaglycine glycine transferase (the first glycine)
VVADDGRKSYSMMQQVEWDKQHWDNTVSQLPGVHILQSWKWGEIKAKYGWSVSRYIWSNKDKKIIAAAQVLQRNIRLLKIGPLVKVIYIPRGPLMDWEDADLIKIVLNDLIKYSKSIHSIFIKIDPEVLTADDVKDSLSQERDSIIKDLKNLGWRLSSEQIQFRNSFWLNLKPTEEDLLSAMKQKTRYNIRLAERKDIKVRGANESDFSMLYDLYTQTSIRDGFIIRPKKYYFTVWKLLFENNKACGLIAEFENIPIAAIILFYFGKKAWYFYGMSSDKHRDKMPNYLLQWEAIKLIKQLGCTEYDLWGAPDTTHEDDKMWGVYRFKQGLGGELIHTIGAWDYPINPSNYLIYNKILPLILCISRRFRRHQINRSSNVAESL